MQWFFGFSQTPTIADGHVALQCELLSPAKRPLQMTADLGAFWFSDTYQSIKKEMKGRYPKHLWPDDPANTEATKLTKRHLNKS
jgi:ATP-dependent helicase HrpB